MCFVLSILFFVVFYVCFCFFFFKQKTAYEMRISDWSSDVCSSDLRGLVDQPADLEPFGVTEQPLDRGSRLACVDGFAETPCRPKGEPEEFELAGRGARAFAEQFAAPRAQLGIMLVGQNFGAGVDRTSEREGKEVARRVDSRGYAV